MTDTMDDARTVVTGTREDRALADAIAGALARYAVAYTHNTLTDMTTADRSWKVHETGHGNPFEHGVWLGEFDNKAEANALAAELRKSAAYEAAARHRLSAEARCAARIVGQEFKPGDKVRKVDGYPFGDGDAEVVAAYRCASGTGPWRYVVEHPEGWQHIFSGKQLALNPQEAGS